MDDNGIKYEIEGEKSAEQMSLLKAFMLYTAIIIALYLSNKKALELEYISNDISNTILGVTLAGLAFAVWNVGKKSFNFYMKYRKIRENITKKVASRFNSFDDLVFDPTGVGIDKFTADIVDKKVDFDVFKSFEHIRGKYNSQYFQVYDFNLQKKDGKATKCIKSGLVFSFEVPKELLSADINVSVQKPQNISEFLRTPDAKLDYDDTFAFKGDSTKAKQFLSRNRIRTICQLHQEFANIESLENKSVEPDFIIKGRCLHLILNIDDFNFDKHINKDDISNKAKQTREILENIQKSLQVIN